MADDEIVARDGDVLVVSYPEIKIPVAPYCTVGVGGSVYTRQLQTGDNVEEQYARIYAFLERRSEADAKVKVATWHNEMTPKKSAKPSGGSR